MAEPVLSPGVLDLVLNAFDKAMTLGWSDKGLMGEAKWLLNEFAKWEVVFTAITWAVSRSQIFSDTLMILMKFGFFVWLISGLKDLTTQLSDSMVKMGLLVGGGNITVSQFMSPGTIFAMGMQTTQPILLYIENLQSGLFGFLDSGTIFIYGFVIILAWICFLLMSAHIVIAVIEFQLLSIMSLMLLPWGIFTHTRFMAEGVIGGLVAGTVRLATLAAVTSIIVPILKSPTLTQGFSTGDPTYQEAFGLLAAAALLMLLSWTAPNFAASLVGNGPALTGGSIIRLGAGVGYAASRAVSRMRSGGGQLKAKGATP